MKKLIGIIMLILLSGMVLAEDIPSVTEVFSEDFLQEIKESYNAQRGNAPQFLVNTFGNERINLYVNGIVVYAVMVDGEMTEVGEGELDDQTMNVFASKETVEKLMREEIGIKEALDSGLIEYEGVGFGSKIKFGFVKAIYKVYSIFS